MECEFAVYPAPSLDSSKDKRDQKNANYRLIHVPVFAAQVDKYYKDRNTGKDGEQEMPKGETLEQEVRVA